MKGIVGVIAQETSRYTKFWCDLENLEAPDGVDVRINYDGTLVDSRNSMVRQFLSTDAGWLMMIDDDHAISPTYLRQWLYRHETKLNNPVAYPIMASLYLQRGAPFAPLLYGPPYQGSFKGSMELSVLSLRDLPTSGIYEVYAAGTSGMFVRRDVYERMPYPWYEIGQTGEDFWFCVKAQKLGISVHVDLDTRIGHIAPFEVWPDVVDGQWVTSIRRGRTGMLVDAARTELLVASVPDTLLV